MRHLDELLDSLKSPVDIVQAWCDADKDRAVVACLKDLFEESGGARVIELISEAYPEYSAVELIELAQEIYEEISVAESDDEMPDINYEKLYSPLEHIINDRIDFYNRS